MVFLHTLSVIYLTYVLSHEIPVLVMTHTHTLKRKVFLHTLSVTYLTYVLSHEIPVLVMTHTLSREWFSCIL